MSFNKVYEILELFFLLYSVIVENHMNRLDVKPILPSLNNSYLIVMYLHIAGFNLLVFCLELFFVSVFIRDIDYCIAQGTIFNIL